MTEYNKNRITWNDRHMLQALVSSLRSPDPNTAVGCNIVSIDNKDLSSGYNGTAKGIHPNFIPWKREGAYLDTKYAYIVHAELNAVLNAKSSLENSKAYVTLQPCAECSKALIQAGIKEIYYLDDKYKDTESCQAATKMLEIADVKMYHYKWETIRAKSIARIAQGDK